MSRKQDRERNLSLGTSCFVLLMMAGAFARYCPLPFLCLSTGKCLYSACLLLLCVFCASILEMENILT